MSYHPSLVWSSPGVLEELRHLWCNTTTTAAVIGQRFGVSRSAVIGKVHRLRLPPRGARVAKNPPAEPRISPIPNKRIKLRKEMQAFHSEPEPLPIDHPPVHFLEVTKGQCRHPLWRHDRKPIFSSMWVCGAPTVDDHPYCPHHRHRNKEPAYGRVA